MKNKKIEDIKVSIIVPTYKRSDYLIRSIESILNQSHKNIEIIVIDDNSEGSEFRKKTKLKLDMYRNDKRVKYIKNIKNVGGSISRNNGIYKSTGEYITFLDDDDIYLVDKISKQLEFMINNNLEVCFTDLRIHNTNNKLIDYRKFDNISSFENSELLKYHITRQITGTPTFMYKAEVIKKIGGFPDVKMGQEFFLMLRTIEENYRIGYLREADVIAYAHDGEKISKGPNKIIWQKKIYNMKKKYFHMLNNKEKRYLKFRYQVVLAIAYKRNNEYFKFVLYMIYTMVINPITVLKEVYNFIVSKIKYK